MKIWTEWSWLVGGWTLAILGVCATGGLALLAPTCSAFVNDLVKYGKSASKRRSVFHQLIEVPKKWFSHFYILAAVTSSIMLYLVASVYAGHFPAPRLLRELVRFAANPFYKPSVSTLSILITCVLLWIHCLRRLFESLFVSVYSDTKMNIIHYICGWCHYIAVPLTILAEAPGFIDKDIGSDNDKNEQLMSFGWQHAAGILLFSWSSYSQHSILHTFAYMRRNFQGNITNYAHGIGYGGWFDLISCPHFFFEILIYVSFFLTLQLQHHLWQFVLIFVISNQIIAGLITHRWYKDKFKDMYPTERKALIPYIL